MRSLKTGKVNKRNLVYFLLLIPFFPVQSIQMMSLSSSLWTNVYNVLAIIRLICAAFAIALFFIKRKKPSILTWGIIAAEIMTFYACYKNGSLTFQFSLTMCMATIGFAMLCQELDDKRTSSFLDANIIFFGTVCFLGVISILLFPNGFNHASQKQFAIWFFGSKNASYYYYAQFLFLLCYKVKLYGKQIPGKVIGYDLIFLMTTLICRSSGGTLMLLVILVGMLALKYKLFFRKILRPRNVLMLVVLLTASIPALSSGAFDWLFQMIGRTSDFSMRTFIWDSAIEMIKESPIFGMGKDGDLIFFGRQTQAHNFYLDFAAKYGIITISLFILTIVAIMINMQKTKNKELLFVGSLFLLTLLVHCLFDSVGTYYLIIVLFFCLKIGRDERMGVKVK